MVREISKITSKGQLTLPIAVRRRLGVVEGDRVEFVENDQGELMVRPLREDNPFEKYRGIGAGDLKTIDDVHQWLRELRGRDE